MLSVTAVVLAAGASERMGEPKLLLPYRDSTVLNATISAVASSAVERIVVVTGFGADRIEASLAFSTTSSPLGEGADEGGGGGGRSRQLPAASRQPEVSSQSAGGREEERGSVRATPPITVVRNPDYRRGNMSSLLTATAAESSAEAFVVVPGDLPTIRTDVIDSMINLWIESRPWAAVTEYSNRIAHPFLLSSAAVASMGELTGEKVLGRLLVESHDARIMRLRVPYGPPRDMNTPDDYEALLTDL